ncbi:MAG: dihydroneopterin aldolase [Mangrovibacterium sp.]
MNGLIELEGMEFYAYHGYFPSERKVGAHFLVSLSIQTDCTAAGASDRLEDALNYQEVYELTRREMQIPSALLEHVCTRILNAIYTAFPQTEQATVKLSKMNPPLGGRLEKVSVTVRK